MSDGLNFYRPTQIQSLLEYETSPRSPQTSAHTHRVIQYEVYIYIGSSTMWGRFMARRGAKRVFATSKQVNKYIIQ